MQLIINAGSSSLKWALFPSLEKDDVMLQGKFDTFGNECTVSVGRRGQKKSIADHADAVRHLVSSILPEHQVRPDQITSVVHRVVHGGEKYDSPAIISESIKEDIRALTPLAPLHNPANLAGIRACERSFETATQIAVFDTAFHHTIPKEAFMYAIPLDLYERFRIRKYGFHGINHGYIASKLKERYGSDVDAISCHLGSGSSITALRQGISVDTTMGFTPLDGVLMATRTGELDPDIPLFLLREGHYTVAQLEELLSKKSGLLGLTGHSDLREIWDQARKGDEKCKFALDMLSYHIAYYINAMKTATPKPKAIVFTGGIGEAAWYIRQHVCEYLALPLDKEKNAQHGPMISSPESPIEVLVIPADEQVHMHRLSRQVIG